MSAIALGYLATFALLSPVSIVCYSARLPVSVFSTACVLLVAASVSWLVRERAWRGLRGALRVEAGVALALLVVHLGMEGRVGSWLDGDATFHVGRIRHLLEHGFDNRDIYLEAEHFTRIYHTNLVHALFAAATQLSGGDLLEAWRSTLPWAKLVIAAGHYFLGYAMFRTREVAWLFLVIVSTVQAGMTYSIYPNTLAVGWLLPTAFAAALLVHDGERRESVVLAALASLVLGQVHALYVLFACVVIGPFAGARWVLDRVRGRGTRPALGLLLVALLAGVPFGLVSRYAPRAPASQPRVVAASAVKRAAPTQEALMSDRASARPLTAALAAGGGHLEKKLERLPDGGWVFRPEQMGGVGFVVLGFAALALALVASGEQRVRAGAALAAGATCAVVLFWPALCTFVVDTLGLRHALPRLVPFLASLLFLGLCGAVGRIVARVPRPARAWPWVTLGAVAVGSQLLGHTPRSLGEHWDDVTASAGARHAMVAMHRERRALLETHVPRGETVLAAQRLARYVVMLHDVYVVAADRGHTRVPGLPERRADVERMIARRTPWSEREVLLRKYGLRYVVFEDRFRKRFEWAFERGRQLGSAGGLHVVDLGMAGPS